MCPTLCDCMNWSPPDSTVQGSLQARILEWVAMPFLRRFSRPRDQTQVSHIAGGFFSICATRDCVCILIPHLINFPREGRDLSTLHSFKEAFFTKDWIKNEAKKWCPKDRSMVGVNLTAVLTLQVSGFF